MADPFPGSSNSYQQNLVAVLCCLGFGFAQCREQCLDDGYVVEGVHGGSVSMYVGEASCERGSVHEAGYAFGLGHTNWLGSVMGASLCVPQPYDIVAVKALYQSRVP